MREIVVSAVVLLLSHSVSLVLGARRYSQIVTRSSAGRERSLDCSMSMVMTGWTVLMEDFEIFE